jgi:SAM-dependent methyltransferase
VALVVAQLVGASGEVVGIERDSRSIARARARVAQAGFQHVEFLQCDVFQIPDSKPFDAVVGPFHSHVGGRSGFCSVWNSVRPGGVAAFHEPYWAPALALLTALPLWAKVASVVHETFLRSGARPELGPDLYRVFQEAGLPGPAMRLDMALGKEPEIAQWFCDIVQTLWPQVQRFGLWSQDLGDLQTLQDRLQAEVAASTTVAAWPAYVGAWVRKEDRGSNREPD